MATYAECEEALRAIGLTPVVYARGFEGGARGPKRVFWSGSDGAGLQLVLWKDGAWEIPNFSPAGPEGLEKALRQLPAWVGSRVRCYPQHEVKRAEDSDRPATAAEGGVR